MGKYTRKTVYTTRMSYEQVMQAINNYFNDKVIPLNSKPYSQAIGVELDYNPDDMGISIKPINSADITNAANFGTDTNGNLMIDTVFAKRFINSSTIEWEANLNEIFGKNIHRINNLYIEFDILYNNISTCDGNNISNLDSGYTGNPEAIDPTEPDTSAGGGQGGTSGGTSSGGSTIVDYDDENTGTASNEDIDNIFVNGGSSGSSSDPVSGGTGDGTSSSSMESGDTATDDMIDAIFSN